MSDANKITADASKQPSTLHIRPFRKAVVVSVCYFIVASVYILLSGQIAALVSMSVSELAKVEQIKGCLFVLTTTMLLFVLVFWMFKRIAADEKQLESYRDVLIASERRAAAGLFASSVAHDIGSILTISRLATSQLGSGTEIPKDKQYLIEQLEQANQALFDLTERLSKGPSPETEGQFTSFDVVTKTRETLNLARLHKKVMHCSLDLEAPDTLHFQGDPLLIHQMVLNLLINAADATGHKGRIMIKIHDQDPDCVIEVHDNGTGILPEDRARIMEPFVTTKTDGSGLGLLSVKACAEAYQGCVDISDSPLGGACFTIRLKNSRTPVA
jgi:signal transduction histidine kinase